VSAKTLDVGSAQAPSTTVQIPALSNRYVTVISKLRPSDVLVVQARRYVVRAVSGQRMAKVVELLDSSTGSVTTFSMAAKPAVLSKRLGPKSRKRKKRVRNRVPDPNAPRRPTKFVGLWTGRGEDPKR
jgi:hypothetical protein